MTRPKTRDEILQRHYTILLWGNGIITALFAGAVIGTLVYAWATWP